MLDRRKPFIAFLDREQVFIIVAQISRVQFAEREEGFRSQRGKNVQIPQEAEEEGLRKRLKRLENELAYTRQEVEFLKKVQEADTEARRQWESKRKPK